MKQILTATLCMLAIGLVGCLSTGCMTSKTQTVTNGVTNTVVVVNQAMLALDCAGLQTVTAGIVNAAAKDKNLLPILKEVDVTLDGILNGINPQTATEALTLLKVGGNAALTQQATTLLDSLSQVEQTLLQKYGTGVAGQISIALATAVKNGFDTGLTGK